MMQQIVSHLIAFCMGGFVGVLGMAIVAAAKEDDRNPFSEET